MDQVQIPETASQPCTVALNGAHRSLSDDRFQQ
jgi:hypothetical protein